jgi:hypothetical protein
VATVKDHGQVDVKVTTSDAWSLELVAHFKRVGGRVHWKAGVTENNLLGQGKALSAIYSKQADAIYKIFNWTDRQFLGKSHLQYSLSGIAGPNSLNLSMGLNRPFFASIARSAVGFQGSYDESWMQTYSGEALTGTVKQRARELGVNWGRALGISTERTRRATVGLLHRREEFDAIPGIAHDIVPNAKQFNFLQVGFAWEEQDFVKERRIQRFTHDEDFNLGFGFFPSVAWSPHFKPLASTESNIVPKMTMRKGFAGDEKLFFIESGYSSTYVNGGSSSRVASIDLLYFLRGFPHQTLAFHTAFDHGWRLDPNQRLSLGEANGLRGYGLSQFIGDRRFLLNIEDRVFVWDELLGLLDIGTVLFFDSGYVWPAGRPERFSDLKHSVGIGLRLAPSKSGSNSPVRIDLARALSDNGTRSRWSVSILAGHAFGPGSTR